jgi:membrane protease YdiL (CAAX protease family)
MLGAAPADVGAVLFTAAAGALLCEHRRDSGSLLAPIGLHWSTNALGYLADYVLAHTT